MSRHKAISTVLHQILPLAILAVGGYGAWILYASRERPEARPSTVPTAPQVETIAARSHTEGLDLEVDGVVVPYRETHLSAEVAGRVISKSPACRAGRFVQQGTVLVEIDPRDYELQEKQLTEQVAQAEASLYEVQVERDNTKRMIVLAERDLEVQRRDIKRLQGLSGERVVTQAELDKALRGELAAENTRTNWRNQQLLHSARIRRLQSAIQLAKSQLEKARLDRERTKIIAPMDGIIVADLIEKDAYVQPGTRVVSLEDTSAVEVRCHLKMDEIYWLWDQGWQGGETATGRAPRGPLPNLEDGDPEKTAAKREGSSWPLPAAPDTRVTVLYRLGGRQFVWNGHLDRYDGAGLDEKTRTIPCRIVVSEPRNVHELAADSEDAAVTPPSLMRGMYVRVHIHSHPKTDLVWIPDAAVRPGNRVWIFANGFLEVRQLEVAGRWQEGVLVSATTSGVHAGDKIIASPLAVPVPGMPLQEWDGPKMVQPRTPDAAPAPGPSPTAIPARRTATEPSPPSDPEARSPRAISPDARRS